MYIRMVLVTVRGKLGDDGGGTDRVGGTESIDCLLVWQTVYSLTGRHQTVPPPTASGNA